MYQVLPVHGSPVPHALTQTASVRRSRPLSLTEVLTCAGPCGRLGRDSAARVQRPIASRLGCPVNPGTRTRGSSAGSDRSLGSGPVGSTGERLTP
jgi:hypothetical protein